MALKRQGLNFRLILHGQRDLVRSWLGLSPHKIPIVGKPGSIACLTAEDAYDGYAKLASKNFINEACARIILRGDKYRPVKYVHKVRCPVLPRYANMIVYRQKALLKKLKNNWGNMQNLNIIQSVTLISIQGKTSRKA